MTHSNTRTSCKPLFDSLRILTLSFQFLAQNIEIMYLIALCMSSVLKIKLNCTNQLLKSLIWNYAEEIWCSLSSTGLWLMQGPEVFKLDFIQRSCLSLK
jgi:hypothetical protein